MDSNEGMIASHIHPGKEKILVLLNEAHNGTLVLPEFQRSFIWARKDIEELLVSIVNGFFIGTLLLLEIDSREPPFEPRVLEGVQKNKANVDTMILDGQQRLTSLYYALHEVNLPLSNTRNPQRFFLDINKLLQGDIENAVFSISMKDTSDLPNEEAQYRLGHLPFIRMASWATFDDWREGYREHLIQTNNFEKDRFERIRNLARGFLEYEVPYVKLDRKIDLNAVVEVFERINRTGTPLSIFALVTARLYSHGVKLRDLWFDAYDTSPSIRRFCEREEEDVARVLLQVVSLLRGRECKRKDLIALEAQGFQDEWRTAVSFVDKAFARLANCSTSGYGVLHKEWLPYSTISAPLAALLHTAENQHPGQNEPYEKLHRWYWSSVFTERYAGASDTVIHSDFNQVSRWFSMSSEVPDSVQRANQIARDIDLGRSRRGAVYKAVMCLIAINGALDFRTGDSIELHVLDDHHIFPKKVLGTSYGVEEVNSILNRTLISRETNQRLIRDRSPSTYLADIESQMGTERMYQILSSHFFDKKAVDYMRSDDFRGFTKHRHDLIISEIQKRCRL